MKKILLVLSLGLICLGQASAQFEKSPYNKLVWSDEFDGEGLPDESKWGYEEGYMRNNEYQYYTVKREENIYQKDGLLHIKCINADTLRNEKGEILNKKTAEGKTFIITSASISTKGHADWQYGRFEIKAKTPMGRGVWPAIWMMPTDEYILQGWPSSGEIDIMEFVGNTPSYVHFTAHSQKYNANKNNLRSEASLCPDSYINYHVYALEWYRDRLDWFIDGELKFTYLNDNPIPGQVSLTEEAKAFPFLNPFHLILNFAYGGSWGGRGGVDLDALPLEYLVDYVRVYQADPSSIDSDKADVVSVYPNPVADVLNIDSNEPIKQIALSDASGKTVAVFNDVDSSIDLSTLNKGYYVIKIVHADDTVSIQKLLKN